MYTFVDAMVKPRQTGVRWMKADLENVVMYDLFKTYAAVILILHHTVTDERHAVSMSDLPAEAQMSRLTLANWLVSIGDRALTVLSEVPVLSEDKVVKYRDAFAAGYTVLPTPAGASHTANVPEGDKHWLRLTKPGLNTGVFYHNCMVSVNGFFHLIDYDVNAVYVVDGNRSSQISGDAHIGIHAYHSVANINYLHVSGADVFPVANGVPLSRKVLLKLPQAINDQTFVLVLGGIAHFFDERIFRQVADDTLMINIDQLDLKTWFQEADANLDLSALPVTRLGEENHLIDTASLYTDETIRALFDLSQTFVVSIEAGNMYRDFRDLRLGSAGNAYLSPQRPIYPIRSSGGRMAEYIYHIEDDVYVVNAHGAKISRYTHQTTSEQNGTSFNNSLVPAQPRDRAPLRFELIGRSF